MRATSIKSNSASLLPFAHCSLLYEVDNERRHDTELLDFIFPLPIFAHFRPTEIKRQKKKKNTIANMIYTWNVICLRISKLASGTMHFRGGQWDLDVMNNGNYTVLSYAVCKN